VPPCRVDLHISHFTSNHGQWPITLQCRNIQERALPFRPILLIRPVNVLASTVIIPPCLPDARACSEYKLPRTAATALYVLIQEGMYAFYFVDKMILAKDFLHRRKTGGTYERAGLAGFGQNRRTYSALTRAERRMREGGGQLD